MEIRVLRYFLTVAREETISRAADILHITQPTLSRQLSQMEEDMGVRLFERGPRKISLTAEGRLLRRRAEEILELVGKTEDEIRHQDQTLSGVISIGCGDLGAVQRLPDLIRPFTEHYPSVTFDLYTTSADHIRDRLDRGVTDIGLLLEPVNMEKYDYVRLSRHEEWVVILPPDSPLSQKEAVTPQDLKDVPLILPRRAAVRSELARWFGPDYEHLHVLCTSNLTSSSSVLVHSGLACSIAVLGSISFWDRTQICVRPLSPALTGSSVFAWKRKQPFSPAAERFIQFVKDTVDAHQETPAAPHK
jgi:transcriptional regulator, lysR family